MTADPLLLKPVAAAELLSISPRTLWTLTKEGKIPHIRIKNRLLRYDPVDCIAALKKHGKKEG